MDKEIYLGHLMDAWKQTVQVQMHFNEVEIKIRGLLITLLTAVIAGVGITIKEKLFIFLFSYKISIALFLLLFSIILIIAFYFMERFWYHRLLYGAVNQGKLLEEALKQEGLEEVQLTALIGKESPIKLCNIDLHSKQKIDCFYAGLLLIPIIGILVISFSFIEKPFTNNPTSKKPISVNKTTYSLLPSGSGNNVWRMNNETGELLNCFVGKRVDDKSPKVEPICLRFKTE